MSFMLTIVFDDVVVVLRDSLLLLSKKINLMARKQNSAMKKICSEPMTDLMWLSKNAVETPDKDEGSREEGSCEGEVFEILLVVSDDDKDDL